MSQISVVSKPARFRRAGLDFTREPRVLDVAALSPEQLAALERETMLVVTHVASGQLGNDAGGQGLTDAGAPQVAAAEPVAQARPDKKPRK
jgi:hypothetical protein